MPRGQGWILVLFIGFALLGADLVSGLKTFERGVEGGGWPWFALGVAGVLVGAPRLPPAERDAAPAAAVTAGRVFAMVASNPQKANA